MEGAGRPIREDRHDRTIVGRDEELAKVDAFLDADRLVTSALILAGEAGIGKTTVWREAVSLARRREWTVLTTRPAESEARHAYGGLTDLLARVAADVIQNLAEPQRVALEVALLQSPAGGARVNIGAVSIAFISLVRRLARDAPVLIAVDDAQWLDASTATILEYAARRFEDDPVAILVGVRTENEKARGFQEAIDRDRRTTVRLGPLSLASLHHMFKVRLDHVFGRPVLVRIMQACHGNPFYAMEIARELIETGEPESGAPWPVPTDVGRLVEARVRRLPTSTREVLLVAAAMATPTLVGVEQAVAADTAAGSSSPDGTTSRFSAAEAAGLISIAPSGRLDFAHPLFAAAIYATSTPAERASVHRRLAAVVGDPEERARHLALGTPRPSAEVARELAAAARGARLRGAVGAAVDLSGFALERCPRGEVELLDELTIDRAGYLLDSGDMTGAERLLRDLTATAGSSTTKARGFRMLAAVAEVTRGSTDALALGELALSAAGDDLLLRAEIHAFASRVGDHDAALKAHHAAAAVDAAERAGDEGPVLAGALLALAEADFHAGRGVRDDLLDRAEVLERQGGIAPPEARQAPNLRAMLQLHADDLEPAHRFLEQVERYENEIGDEAHLGRILGRLAILDLRLGELDAAERRLGAMRAVLDRTRQPVVWTDVITANLRAVQGRLDEAAALAGRAIADPAVASQDWLRAEALAALGLTRLIRGDARGAASTLDLVRDIETLLGVADPGLFHYAADRIEAMITVGLLDRAGADLEAFERQGRDLARPWILAAAGRCRGLLRAGQGDLDGAVTALDAALIDHRDLPMPVELGRTLLVLGRVQRRRRHHRAARDAFAEAASIFEPRGADVWASMVREELSRTHVRESGPDLTPTESQVAELAAGGLTNRLIAERLFVSPKTVEANLARVYRKLGIESRAALGVALARPAGTQK